MKKIIMLLLICVTFASCDLDVSEGRDAYKNYFKQTLVDPNSFVVYNESYTQKAGGSEIDWTIDFGARNSFGGMVRQTAHFKTFGGMIDVEE